jgi:tRNA(adenine34) deaminase|tara:strand:+ start:404 stop:862 length:459 start_codon:yes stop_codon:yes gene_type:complete
MLEYSENEIWMLRAFKQAEKAYACDEVPIGCIIVHDNKIIGQGHNMVEKLKDSTAHAEMLSITSAANYINDWRLNECSIYVTKEPCIMCFGAILNSRIKNLFYGVEDSSNGFQVKVLNENLFSKHLEKIQSGILGDKCKSILKDFFEQKRKK